MRCPNCRSPDTRVIETREADDAIRRRRECEACRFRFTTYERPQFHRLVVRSAGGAQRTFTRAWLAKALHSAGADLPPATLQTIAATIEAQLRAERDRIISTADVAALAVRQVGAARPFATANPTPEQVTVALDATLPVRRRAPAQLPLPMERMER
jgi:transcriptional repressor NrdR